MNVIVTTGGSPSARAAKAATGTIPIVFTMEDADPVQAGFVDSLKQAGRESHRLDSLVGALVTASDWGFAGACSQCALIAVLVNPSNPSSPGTSAELEMRDPARSGES